MKKWFLGATACAVASLALLISCASALATVHVTSTSDEGSGVCTLRGAIEAVNSGSDIGGCTGVESGQTTIEVPANTYSLNSTLELKAGADAKILGTGGYAVLSGADKNRVMKVQSGATVTLANVEIVHGRAHNAPVPVNVYSGFAGEDGGGILNAGSLTLEACLVTENAAGNGANGLGSEGRSSGGSGTQGGSGGGIYNTGSLSIYGSTISDNRSGKGGNGGPGGDGEAPSPGHNPQGLTGGTGAPSGSGGGIFNAGGLYIENSTISGNATERGGNGGGGGRGAGAQNKFGSGTGGDGGEGGNNGKQYLKNSAEYEEAARGGGGIANIGGSLTMVGSTISGNNAGAGGNGGGSGPGGQWEESNRFSDSGRAGIGGGGGRGGGLLTAGINSPVHLTNVTVYGNFTGEGGLGGGGGGGADNTLGGGAGGYGGDGGGIWSFGAANGSEAVLTQVTIAGNAVASGGLGGGSPDPKFIGSPGPRGLGAGIATGGRYNPSGSAVFLKNSIVAVNGNPALGDTNCNQHYIPPTYDDLYDLGNNLTFPSGLGANETCPGTVGNPAFGPFGNNGGPTQTLVPSAAAIGLVPLAACSVATDQRGLPRHAGAKESCDAGAVETTLTGPAPPEEPIGETPGGGGAGGGGGGNPSTGGGGNSSTGGGSPPPPLAVGLGAPRASAGSVKVSGTSVSVPIACSGAPCAVKATIYVAPGGKATGSSAYAAKKPKGPKKLTVGGAAATIAAGQTKTISVPLNAKGKALLKRTGKLKATVVVTLGGAPVLTRAVSFKAKS
jgi:hypothetical protein